MDFLAVATTTVEQQNTEIQENQQNCSETSSFGDFLEAWLFRHGHYWFVRLRNFLSGNLNHLI